MKTKGELTPEALEARQGVNIGFFYLREKGAEFGEKKCKVCVKGNEIRVWDGASWRSYSEFEPLEIIADRIKDCEKLNGKIP